MSIKTLLAILDPHAANGVLLNTACSLSARWKARVDVVLPYPPLWNPDLISVADESARERVQEIEEHARRIEEALGRTLRQEFETACDKAGIDVASDTMPAVLPFARMFSVSGFDRGCRTVDRARLADIILARRLDSEVSEDYGHLVGLVLRGSGRPVVLLPPAYDPEPLVRVAIAWNGSGEAVHALRGAMDIIARAGAVDVLVAESERTASTIGDELIAYLACHEIVAQRRPVVRQAGQSVGEGILDTCYELAANLLVMGGKTHNRWREMGFGGVTHHVSAHANLPVLMAQ